MADAHVASVGLVKVKPNGDIIGSGDTISGHLEFSTEHRVLMNPNIPNTFSTGTDDGEAQALYPTMEEYIVAEATDGFILRHLSQYTIITSTN